MEYFAAMDLSDSLAAAGVILVAALLLMGVTRRLKSGHQLHLRPMPALKALEESIGQASESASRMHISLGRASLISPASPSSVAATSMLDHLATEGCASDLPPIVTVGDGTLLLIAQERLRDAYRAAGRLRDYTPDQVQFVAHSSDPYAYAAGVSTIFHQNRLNGNVLAGHYGPEVAIIAENATRGNIAQIVGSDDPVALAVGSTITEDLLVGEELLGVGAYLARSHDKLAALQTQDVLRLAMSVAILGIAIYHLIVG
jgi:hypothetical protein